MIGAGDVKDVKHIQHGDFNNDGVTNQDDYKAQAPTDDNQMVIVDGFNDNQPVEWGKIKGQVDKLFAASATNNSPVQTDLDKALKNLAEAHSEFQSIQGEIDKLKKTLESNPPNKAEIEKQIKLFEMKLKLAEARRTELQKRVEAYNVQLHNEPTKGIPKAIADATGKKDGGGAEYKTQVFTGNSGGGSSGSGGAGSGFRAQTTGGTMPGAPFTPPSGWGAQVTYPPLPTDAFLKSTMMEDTIQNSFASILSNQSKGKELMLLMMKYAQMAASGDLGAMYQFMRFITYIISKDKALELTAGAKKMMELQEASRQMQARLTGTAVDANDPNSSTNFTKVMMQTQAETQSIATSQKLLGQMMEETVHVVELMTNVTKGFLEGYGRVLRTVSTMRS